jgi:Arm DNA-binding domain
MMLTDTAVRTARPRDKDYKITDSGGLYLHVYRTGRKVWRFKFRYNGEQLLTFRSYPEIGLREARDRRDEARRALAEGRDPRTPKHGSAFRGNVAGPVDFQTMATRWWGIQKDRWVDRHAHDVWHSLERDVFPLIGKTAIADLTEKTILATLREIKAGEAEDIWRPDLCHRRRGVRT